MEAGSEQPKGKPSRGRGDAADPLAPFRQAHQQLVRRLEQIEQTRRRSLREAYRSADRSYREAQREHARRAGERYRDAAESARGTEGAEETDPDQIRAAYDAYLDALREVEDESDHRLEAVASDLQSRVQGADDDANAGTRAAFEEYVVAVKAGWGGTDPKSLDPGSLAALGESLLAIASRLSGR